MLPAVGQGAIALELREDDAETGKLCEALNDTKTALEVTTERAMLAELDGSCRTPIAGLAKLDSSNQKIYLRAFVAKPDGSVVHEVERKGTIGDATEIGVAAGQELQRKAGPNFLP